jgi:hypothetical protein
MSVVRGSPDPAPRWPNVSSLLFAKFRRAMETFGPQTRQGQETFAEHVGATAPAVADP